MAEKVMRPEFKFDSASFVLVNLCRTTDAISVAIIFNTSEGCDNSPHSFNLLIHFNYTAFAFIHTSFCGSDEVIESPSRTDGSAQNKVLFLSASQPDYVKGDKLPKKESTYN